MRLVHVKAITFAFVIITSLVPVVVADNQIELIEENSTPLQATTFWNYSDPVSTYSRLAPKDFCVSSDGTLFTVNLRHGWEITRSVTIPASFAAFSAAGDLLWIKRYYMWPVVLFGITTDDSHVYVAGMGLEGLFVGKYDLLGNSVWNYTDDLGESDCGLRISVSDEGNVIVRASSPVFAEYNLDAHLVVLNRDGEYRWHKSFERPSFVNCDSKFIYIVQNSFLEKFDQNGSLIWSTPISYECRLTAHNNILYSHEGLGQTLSSILTIMSWNPITGGRMWSSSVTMKDNGNNQFNITAIECSSTQNESLVAIIAGPWNSTSRWHLLMIDNSGYPSRYNSILDTSWRYAFCEPIESGQLLVAGYSSETKLSIAIFDLVGPAPQYSISVSEPYDIFLISITLVGVVLFDTSLIIYLKRRYSKT